MTQTSGILNFIRETTFDDLPNDVVKMAERCCLDLIGVAAAGRSTEASKVANRIAQNLYAAGNQSSNLLFGNGTASPAGAAFSGAVTIDSFDAHDGHRITKGHAGAAILPALLAYTSALKAQGKDITGQEFLCCLVIGYEISLRAGIALHETVCDYHTSGAWNAIGAAAMGARLLNLDMEQTRHALGIAEYNGPRSQMMRCIDHPTMLKDGSGWGAMAGVSAAYLAQEGFTGAPAITLEADECDKYWSSLHSDWEILKQYFKPVPVCRWAQPAIQVIWDLNKTRQIDHTEIKSIEINTFHEALRLAGHAPKTTEEAQYAIAFPVAALLCNGQLGAQEISDKGLSDPDILALSQKITLKEKDKYNDAFPGERWADLTITLTNGEIIQTPAACPIGDPENPLSDQQISEKFHKNCADYFSPDQSKDVERSVSNLKSDPTALNNLLSQLK